VITPELLADHPLVSCEKDDTQQLVDKAFRKKKLKQKEVAEVSLASAIATLVAEGVGAAIVDPFSAQYASEVHPGVVIKPFKPSIPFRFFILLPSLRTRSEVLDKFIALFIKQAEQLGVVFTHSEI
jgi:DNA-binding transcriptional LysR family regulator